ncbi:MAG: hypothetical protein KGI27_04980 [Thaumarchaeota archaeon]|nr:hypothetical protein [Nitrososphaerota archaeon]
MTSNVTSTKSEKSTENNETLSICDIMKDNLAKIIGKMESQVPTYVKTYSDIYTEYLHMIEDSFGTCYISQKELFDKLGFDQKNLKNFNNYWNVLTQVITSQIDMSTNFMKVYAQTRIATIKSYDQYMHPLMDNYAKTLSQFVRF